MNNKGKTSTEASSENQFDRFPEERKVIIFFFFKAGFSVKYVRKCSTWYYEEAITEAPLNGITDYGIDWLMGAKLSRLKSPKLFFIPYACLIIGINWSNYVTE
jgi:hypothetical protein